MKPILSDAKPVLRARKSEAQLKHEQRQAKLAVLAEKKARGMLALEDIDAKLDMIIEMLQDLASL